ncbi:hypothetical protein ACS0TY_036665 [Phlomoides rotata]
MSGLNISHATLFSIFIFLIASSFKLSYCIGNHGLVFCPRIEKQSLQNFKLSLEDPESILSSWEGDVNCCKWDGVVCNNLTGRVEELHLQQGLSGKLNPSLLDLKHLRYLDLSGNQFGATIPSFIGSFTNLEYLNFSNAGFHGRIPHDIGNLSNLHTLDLGGNLNNVTDSQVNFFVDDSLEWLSGLSQLEYLDMDYVNLKKATNWAQVINTHPSLVELHFRNCSLDFMVPWNDVNVTSLKFLDLSLNFRHFANSIVKWIFHQSNLVFLDLSRNFLNGPMPSHSNATKLQHIDLSFNIFNSSIPDWLYFCKDLEFVDLSGTLLQGTISNAIANLTSLNTLNLPFNSLSGKLPTKLCKIKSLDLSFNEFKGDISDSFGNMSDCFLEALESLFLKGNELSGRLTNQFANFKRLQILVLAENSLSGAIPISLGKLFSLKILALNDNKFIGNLPESFGQLFKLKYLDISNNMLGGVVTESHFVNLAKLEVFSASGNHLTLKVTPNWIPPVQLKNLRLGSWNLSGGSHFPSWLEKPKNIGELDLSNTGISGNVPSWCWEIPFLNLSHNHLHGKIPYISGPQSTEDPYMYSSGQYILLSSNQFSGPLPRIGDTMKVLDLSNNSLSGDLSHFLCDTMANHTYGLRILCLEGNQLSGELPDCWMKWKSLEFLSLGNNNIFGIIPNSMGHLVNLRSLNLYGNRISGQIPFSLQNCTSLVKMDLANNDLVGNIPAWVGTSLVELSILILRSNKMSGKVSSELCNLNSLQILDLSDNSLSGKIPRCVYNFTAMATERIYSLNAQHVTVFRAASYSYSVDTWDLLESAAVVTKGRKAQYDTILWLVTNLDLSNNNLSGDIPEELTSLIELRSLNLSANHLTGLVPDSIGDMKQLESLDLSRNSLSGQIPTSLALISSLNYLNLSCNNLTGRIPTSTQLQSLNASSFISNNLCGPPLEINCSSDGDEPRGHKDKNEDEGADESKIEWLYVVVSLGYAVGFSVVCSALVLMKAWREAYFGLLESMWDKLYVYVCIKWIRLTKPSNPTS